MARKGLPSAIVKQYGVTKKAWDVYRGRSSQASRSVSKTAKKKRRSIRSRARAAVSRGSKLLGQYGAAGAVEDAAIGYFGTQLLMGRGYPIDQAMPMTRVIQGAVMRALKRRGSGRLTYGLIDLVDTYLIRKGFNLQSISLGAWQ